MLHFSQFIVNLLQIGFIYKIINKYDKSYIR